MYVPPGKSLSSSSTSSSPPKPLNTRENNDAPINIMKTMLVTRVVLRTTSVRFSRLSCFLNAASNMAPTAPMAAASVGVAKPPMMEPSTTTISNSGGTRLSNTSSTRRFECLSASLGIAGMAPGFINAINARYAIYRPTSNKPGITAPTNRSPTEIVSGEKMPMSSCAC